jgi:hypothetical protein
MKVWPCLLFAILACGEPREQPVTRDPDFHSSLRGSLDPKFPYGSELSISNRTQVTETLRRTIESAMRDALARAMTCMDGVYGSAPMELEIDATGKVTKAKVTQGLLSDTPIAACIEAAFGKMQIGAVQGAPIQIFYPVRNMPSDQQMREAAELLKRGL